MQYHDFVGKVQNQARLGTTGEAVRATRATLEVLGQRMHAAEAGHLASQLPEEIGKYLKDGQENQTFGLDEFFERASENANVDLPDAAHHARAVMSVVKEAVSEGQMNDVRAQLPEEYDPLFESGSEGELN
jgi:uncharacterized protein (DUF2267 family)